MILGSCARGSVSRSISARNYIQLPTPSSSEIFKHRLSTDQNSNPYRNHHHRTAYISSHSITMLSPFSEMSFFEDPSDIEMDDLSLPKRPIQIKKSLRSIRSAFKHDRTPVKEIPGIPQLALYDNLITPNIPIDLSSLHVYDPSNHIIWEKTFQR